MKFGKRLAQEAARKFHDSYFDYKLVKKAIKDDISENDAQGTHFQRALVSELQKVSASFSTKAAQLEAAYQVCLETSRLPELSELRSEVQELIKFVALNYLAVVKAIKKRNRHLKENFGSAANTSLHALDLLIGEVFFTSPRLASLATQAEVLARDLQGACNHEASIATGSDNTAQQLQQRQQKQQQLLEEYTCPVCLDTLHNPVVLTCAHRFCWGCLVAHCTSSRDTALSNSSNKAQGSLPTVTSYRVLEDIACTSEAEAPTFYPCPVCRKPQILDIDTLQVDTHLEQFITSLQINSNETLFTTTTTEAATLRSKEDVIMNINSTGQPTQQDEPWGIIPPQAPEHKGKLCVLLDLDGTLVSSFTPRRAPRLPRYVRTHVVGVGSKLNPQGVFVVERPGLTPFLEQLALFAEVVVFTAGLEDYASPIINAIDPSGRLFTRRIYREGTLRTEHYQCVKDMARLNRDLARTVLVDDTPLAFLHQPDNGVPVLGFRGDPDDRLLLEAVLPLLQSLADEPDVTPVLHRRFDMGGWFRRHGFPVDTITKRALADAAAERERHMVKAAQPQVAAKAISDQDGAALRPTCLTAFTPPPIPSNAKNFLLLADFDFTLTDWDAGERVADELAPELLPMLVGVECPASCVPITNTILSEMQRRGVPRDRLLAVLHEMGAHDMPSGSLRMLQDMRDANVDVKILSDCNSVFILHILAGARAAGLVQDIITNPATFERTDTVSDANTTSSPINKAMERLGRTASNASSTSTTSRSSSCSSRCSVDAAAPQPGSPGRLQSAASGLGSAVPGYKLVITPWHGAAGRPAHQCSMCPSNMCKGREVRALRQSSMYKRIVFVGDGANDVCGALCLGPNDVVLARVGRPMAAYLDRAAKGEPGYIKPQASSQLWSTHDQLQRLVASLVMPPRRRQ